jgi:hypothetical protein
MPARRRGTALRVTVAVVAAVLVGVVAYLGLVGNGATLRAGTQSDVCGVKVGVLDAGETVDLSWGDDSSGGRASLAVGERSRLTPWCVLTVEAVEAAADSTNDGGGASVAVRWRLW